MMNFLFGLGLGAGLMYMFDPVQGRRRRGLLRDQLIAYEHRAEDMLGKATRDLSNRAQGMIAETRHWGNGKDVPDYILVERVRSQIGRVVSHPGALEVTASRGRVALSGQILADEVDDLLSSVAAVHGVIAVENHLEVPEDPEHSAYLQGGVRIARRAQQRQTDWSPTARVLMGLGGSVLVLYGAIGRNIPSLIMGGVGLGMFADELTKH
jgi:hypothetical protein